MYRQVGNVLKPIMNDLQKHRLKKEAKVHIEKLEAIIKVLNLSEKALKMFEIYIPVRRILISIREERLLLDKHLKKQKEIINEY